MVQIGRPSIVQRHGQLERFTGSLIVTVRGTLEQRISYIDCNLCDEMLRNCCSSHRSSPTTSEPSFSVPNTAFPLLQLAAIRPSTLQHCSTAGQVPGHRDTQTRPHLEFCNLHWHPHGAGRGEDTAERRVLHSAFTLTRSSAVSGLPGCSLLPRANWENNLPHFTWDDHKETGTTKSVGSELCFAIYLIF